MNAFSLLTSSFSLHLVQVLAHFLWQGSLIALVAAGASWLLRRRSAQSRYLLNFGDLGLMVLCLPATSVVLERYGEPKTPVSPSPAAAESAPLEVATEPRLTVPDTPMGPFSTESVPQTAPASVGDTSDMPTDVLAWPWQSLAPYVMSVYLLGVAVMLLRLVSGLAASHRMRRNPRPVVDAELLELVARQARALGLRFAPAVCYCERIAVPALVGVLRPMVLLPISLASNLTPQEIEAILTHELAHLRRYDPLVNLLQRIVEAMLFFHPAVWYVSRRIGLEREHCCDDLVVAAGKQPLAYAQSLVRIAELSLNATQPRLSRWASLLRSSGDRPSQLRGRILRLLGDVEDSRVRLTRAGAMTFVAVVVASVALALGAIRATAATDGGLQAVDTKEETVTTVESESSEPTKTVSGQVVDEQGQPIAGARLWLRVGYEVEALGPQGKSRFLFEGESDAQGRFRFAVPEAWFADIDSTGNRGATLWGWAEGYQLESEPSSWPSRGILFQDNKAAEIKLVLKQAADMTLVVTDPDRRPLEGIAVAPQCYKLPRVGISSVLPQETMAFLTGKTDAQGRVRLHGIAKSRLTGVSATTEQFGEQILYVPREAGVQEPALVLERVGRIEGRLTADDPGLVRGVRVDITTVPRSKPGTVPEGQTTVVADAEGRFVVPAIAEGLARFEVRLDEHSPVLPKHLQNVDIRAGDATQVEIPLLRGIPVSGVVRVKDSHVPVAGARLSLCGARATTDAEGKYTALVLPGVVRTEILSLPVPYARREYVSATVPADARESTLPPLEVVPAQPLEGRLIGPEDQPVAKATIWIKSTQPQGEVQASGNSDEDGRFVLNGVPEGEKAEDLVFRIQWTSMSEDSVSLSNEEAKLVTTEPLVLRVEHAPDMVLRVEREPDEKQKPKSPEGKPAEKEPAGEKAKPSPSNPPEPKAVAGQVVDEQGRPAIEGRLVDEENRPLDDASIVATDAEGQDIGSDRTREGGRFVLQGIPQGRSVQDYRYWACLAKTPEAKRAVILQTQPLLLRLERPLVIEGMVVDLEGQPVAGAAVEIIRSDRMWMNPHPGEESSRRSTRTDTAGRFVVTGFPASTSQVVFVRHLERKLSAFVTVEAPNPDPDKPMATLRVPLQPGGRAVGRVLVDGRPQAGLEVPLVALSPNLAVVTCSAVTNAQGYYSIESVTPGLHWEVGLRSGRGYPQSRPFTVKPGETVELGTLHVLRQPKSIAGRVVDPQDNPVPQAEVRVAMRDESLGEIPYNFTHTVEKDGRFRVNLLPDVPLRITAMIRPLANAPDQQVLVSTTVDANAGDENVRIVLKTDQQLPPLPPMMRETASILTGKVLLPDGKPAQGASIALATRCGEVTVRGGGLRWTINSKPQALVETAADGSFQITREPCPSVLVVAHKSGYAEVITEEFARSNTVQLKRWGRLEGEMVLNGKPVAGQTIDVGAGRGDVDVALNYNDSVTTDAAGKFVVERVPPVRLFVNPLFRQGDFQYNLLWFSGQVSITPGETTRIAIPRPGRPVIGRLAFPPESGLRLADFSIEASIMLRPPSMAGFTINVGDTDQDDEWRKAYGEFMNSEFGKAFRRDKIPVGADGTFRIEGLPESSYLLRVTAVRKPGSPRADGSPTDAYIARNIDIPPLAESSEPVDVGELMLQVQVPSAIERGMMGDGIQYTRQRRMNQINELLGQPPTAPWSLQVPEDIERGMMMDRVRPQMPR